MVDKAFDLITRTIHNSYDMSHTKLVTAQQFMNNTFFDKNDIIPLMAKPYEDVNVTNGGNDGSQVVIKPPDKPNG
ncbi:unnamed protein product [Rotaria sordida]|uniref:Uncharacterized protein n=1 Tax=Rotaria sordida TaxID=392033 RepID=A0A818ZBG6_9BILA|nr:unnamed protein product [Rotaria sordida]CAF3761415.1 unnamed protein product [Rotaria sordida]